MLKLTNSTEKIGGALLLGAAAGLGYFMNEAAANKQLWSYEAFFLLGLFWAGCLGLFGGWMSDLPNRRKLVAASSATGVLLWLGFSFAWGVWALWLAFVPLLWAEQEVYTQRFERKSSHWTVFKLAFNSFFIWNILATYWVANTGFVASCFAFILNALFMSVPFVAFHFAKKQHNIKIGMIAFACFWLSFEWWHLYWDLSWPWLTLGNSFAHSNYMVQWYEYTGVFGGSLWILWVNLSLFFNLQSWRANHEQDRLNWAAVKQIAARPLLMIVVPVLVSLLILFSYRSPSDARKVEVLALQPNYEPHFEKFNSSYPAVFANFQQLITQNATEKTRFAVFPETSFDDFQIDGGSEQPLIRDLDSIFSQFPNLNLVVGIHSVKIYGPNDKTPAKVGKVYNRNNEPIYYNSFNSAIFLNKNNLQQPLDIYHKSKLVPGSEIMPYIGGIRLFSDFIMDLGGTTGYALTTQAQRHAFQSSEGNSAPIICYESIYGDFVTNYIKKGAQVLFVMTNDGWWGDTHGYRQHHQIGALRAIETRRWMVRAANTGRSCFINPLGQTLAQTQYGERAALRGEVEMLQGISFYVRYGDIIGRVSLLLTIILLISSINKIISPSKKEVQQLRKDNNL